MPQMTRTIAPKPIHAPIAVFTIRRTSIEIRCPQPFNWQISQQTNCMATIMRMPGSNPPMNRSEIDRFIRKP